MQRVRIHGSRAALRKIHSIVTDVIRLVMANLERIRDRQTQYQVQLRCARAIVVIQYQADRGVIDRRLASKIISDLRTLSDAFTRMRTEDVRRIASNIRLLMDGLVAYLYNVLRG